MSSQVPKPLPTDLPIHAFSNAQAFEDFLEQHHQTNTQGIYLKLAKKDSGIPSIAPSEAVEIALCFGWIDGRANSIDAEWWTVRYTPRRARSMWSKKNVDTVERLLMNDDNDDDKNNKGKENETKKEKDKKNQQDTTTTRPKNLKLKIRPAGLAAIEAAKKDGRWARAYAGPATIQVPPDFQTALDESPTAKMFFDTLNRTDRYSVLWRIETASSQKGRAARIDALVQMLSVGKKIGRDRGGDDEGGVNSPVNKAGAVVVSVGGGGKGVNGIRKRSSAKTKTRKELSVPDRVVKNQAMRSVGLPSSRQKKTTKEDGVVPGRRVTQGGTVVEPRRAGLRSRS